MAPANAGEGETLRHPRERIDGAGLVERRRPAPGSAAPDACVSITAHGDNVVRVQIPVEEELYERARELAKRKGISLAELCRRHLQEAVSRVPSCKPWMAYAGDLDGHPDDSSTVDEVVYGRDEP